MPVAVVDNLTLPLLVMTVSIAGCRSSKLVSLYYVRAFRTKYIGWCLNNDWGGPCQTLLIRIIIYNVRPIISQHGQ